MLCFFCWCSSDVSGGHVPCVPPRDLRPCHHWIYSILLDASFTASKGYFFNMQRLHSSANGRSAWSLSVYLWRPGRAYNWWRDNRIDLEKTGSDGRVWGRGGGVGVRKMDRQRRGNMLMTKVCHYFIGSRVMVSTNHSLRQWTGNKDSQRINLAQQLVAPISPLKNLLHSSCQPADRKRFSHGARSHTGTSQFFFGR